MKSSYETIIRPPMEKVFLTVADLARWPEFLPHYRYNRFIRQTASSGLVEMSCYRLGFPLKWVSEYRIDLPGRKLTFRHLEGALNATQGLDIVWNFEELAENSVRVRLTYEFTPRVVIGGRLLAALVLGELFVHNLAEKTLAGLKRKMEVRLTPAAAVSLPPAKQASALVRGRRIRRRISSHPRVSV